MIRIEGLRLPLKNEVICRKPFIIHSSNLTCLCGVSGSGKSTLLYLLGLLDDTNECCYEFDGHVLNLKSDQEKSEYRKHLIGYVFQESNLLLHLSIEENWQLAAKISGFEINAEDIKSMLELLGLDKTGKEKITELSGGQQQRVAIGMALIKKPRLLLLDEPTSFVDKKTSEDLIALLKKIAKENELMIVVASHSKIMKENADVVYEIKNREIRCLNTLGDGEIKKENKTFSTLFSTLKYTQQYFIKFWKSKLLMSLLCSLVIAFFVVSTSISSQIIQRQQDILSDMVSTEIKVSKNMNGAYYEEGVESFEKDIYKDIIEMEHVEGYLPIVAMHTVIADEIVDILPYSSLMGLEEFKAGTSSYISYDLGNLLNINEYPYSMNLNAMYNGDLKDYQVDIKGSLKSTYANTISTSKYVIYIEEKEFYDLFYTLAVQDDFIPNTMLVYVDYYANVNQTKMAISSILGTGSVESEFIDLATLNESTTTFSIYLKLVSASLCLMLCLMLILIYSRYLINREYEFCILKANGLTKKEVQHIMMNDIIIQGSLFTVCSFIYVVVVCEIMKLSNVIQQANYVQTFYPIIIISFGSLLIPLIISIKKVNQFSPAKFLRR